MSKKKYTSKQDVISKGIVKKNGVFYKQTLLEFWYSKGWLESKNSCYGSDDRLRFGLKLMRDYHYILKSHIATTSLENTKVDISLKVQDDNVLDAINRYRRVLRSIPKEFWPIVRRICLEEKEPEFPSGISIRHKSYFYFLYRIDLCRGLDRVIDAYTNKLK